jgi:hypothetical protein
VSTDAIIRSIAVLAAVALLAAPYFGVIVKKLSEAASAAAEHAVLLGRLAAAGLIIAAAWGVIPMPTLQTVPAVTPVEVPEPDAEMRRLVAPVAEALDGLPAADEALWAATWLKAATVVKAEGSTTQPVFTDTAALRLFTTIALDIAWRRLGDHRPGSVEGLREAVEGVMKSSIGMDARPVTPDVRASYVAAAEAIAWAGR